MPLAFIYPSSYSYFCIINTAALSWQCSKQKLNFTQSATGDQINVFTTLIVHSDRNCGRLTVWSKVTVLSTSLKQNSLHQMVDLEKDTLRWWFSPRSWLWNLIRDSIASSTEPNWMRAILRSFLRGLIQYFKTSRKYHDNL